MKQSALLKATFTIKVTTVKQELTLTPSQTTDGRLCIIANKDVNWTIDGTANYTIDGNSVYITTTSNEKIKVTATTKDGSETKEKEIQTN